MRARFWLMVLLLTLPASAFAQPRVPVVAEYCDDGFVNTKKLFFKSINKQEGDRADDWEQVVLNTPGFVREYIQPGIIPDISRGAGMRIQWRTGLKEAAPIVFTASTKPQQSTDEDGNILLWYTVTRQFIADDVNRVGYIHGLHFIYVWHYLGGDTNAEIRVPCGAGDPQVPPTPPTTGEPPKPPNQPWPSLTLLEQAIIRMGLDLNELKAGVQRQHEDANVSFNKIDNKQDALAHQLKEHDDNPGVLKRFFGNHYVQLGIATLGAALGTRQIVKPDAPAPQPATP